MKKHLMPPFLALGTVGVAFGAFTVGTVVGLVEAHSLLGAVPTWLRVCIGVGVGMAVALLAEQVAYRQWREYWDSVRAASERWGKP